MVVIDESKLASDIVERVQLPQLELQKLRKLATNPDGFSGFVTSVFGDGVEDATIEDLRSMLVSEDFRWSPAVATNRSQRLPDQNGPSVAPFGETLSLPWKGPDARYTAEYLEAVGQQFGRQLRVVDSEAVRGAELFSRAVQASPMPDARTVEQLKRQYPELSSIRSDSVLSPRGYGSRLKRQLGAAVMPRSAVPLPQSRSATGGKKEKLKGKSDTFDATTTVAPRAAEPQTQTNVSIRHADGTSQIASVSLPQQHDEFGAHLAADFVDGYDLSSYAAAEDPQAYAGYSVRNAQVTWNDDGTGNIAFDIYGQPADGAANDPDAHIKLETKTVSFSVEGTTTEGHLHHAPASDLTALDVLANDSGTNLSI
ncbi:MAG: hypothetical protein AAFV29_11610, partial [Myxococcota bacterium]